VREDKPAVYAPNVKSLIRPCHSLLPRCYSELKTFRRQSAMSLIFPLSETNCCYTRLT